MAYIGKAKKPQAAPKILIPTKSSSSTVMTIRPATTTAAAAAPTRVLRRPILSDRKPSGHCAAAPPTTVDDMNHAASDGSFETPAVNTGASAQNAPLAMPCAKQPTVPAGEIRNSRRRSTSTSCGCSGVWDLDSATGTAPRDTSTDAMTNSCRPDGSYSNVIIWPAAITVSVIMT